MSYSQSDITKALSTVEDPDLKRDLVSLNMIKDIKVEPRKVSFTVVLTTPACPLKEKIRQDCEDAVRKVAEARRVPDEKRFLVAPKLVITVEPRGTVSGASAAAP